VFEVSGDARGEWDGDRLCQVLTNLIGNALDYGTVGTEVLLRVVGVDEERVTVQVHNGGVIPEAVRPTLFDPFRRGAAPSGKARGLGLGLYITHQIVGAHGGTIELRSRPEEGTLFHIELPRRPEVRAAASP
jgi:signal transduction histidine kinase